MIASAAVAVAIGVVPALVYSAPAIANINDLQLSVVGPVDEGGTVQVHWEYTGVDGAGTYAITTAGSGTNPATLTDDYTVTGAIGTPDGGDVGDIAIAAVDDALYEGTEQFTLTAASSTDSQTVTVTINDLDDAPTLTLSGPGSAVAEPASGSFSTGTTQATITAELSSTVGTQRSTVVTLNSYGGTATSGADFTPLATTVTFPADPSHDWTDETADVDILGDATKDSATTEQLTVVGTSPGVSNTSQLTATVGITDATADAANPKLTLTGSSTAAEAGDATFTVTPDHKSDSAMSVVWSSVDTTPAANHGVATAGTDFTYPAATLDRTVTIPARDPSKSFPVHTLADGVYDPDEDYTISIGTPTNADLGAVTTKKSTITDPSGAPTVAITPATVTEGNTGSAATTFTATLSQPSTQTVTAKWATTDGSARGGLDYVRTSGTLTFAAGVTKQTFTVNILGDTVDEGASEDFSIDLTAPDNTSMGSSTITITDDDNAPTVSFDNLKFDEGNAPAAVLVPIKLSNASSEDIHLDVTTAGGTAGALVVLVGNQDYSLLNDVATIPAGATTGYVALLINGDDMYEPDETVNLSAAVTGPDQTYVTAPFTVTSTATLANDDAPPTLAINDVTGNEGDTVTVTGTLMGSSYIDTVLSVVFNGQAAGGMKAAEPGDFTNPGAVQVTVPAGSVSGDKIDVAKVVLTDDTASEGDESIVVSGIGVGNIGTVKNGVIKIAANDGGKPNEPGEGALTIHAPKNIVGAIAVPITGKAPADSPVDLWAAPMGGGGELKKILSTKSDKDGNYSFSRWIGEGYRFAAASGEDQSDEVMVTVTQNPVFVAGSPRKGVLSLAVQGNPRGPGQTVIVQRAVSGMWVNTWRGTTGGDNIWRGTAKVASGTVVTIRAFVAGYTPDGLAPGYTAAKKVTIK